ncbi:MAG: type 4a pilus biogenesis protein PilO [Candidatus Sungbacteria bacterium]|nr:type 4a pilus biogenesis protein PilO [Candidatus Sungbacteria bacterium]
MSKLLLSLFILIAAGAAGYLYVIPKYNDMQLLQKQAHARQAVLDELNGLLEKKAELEDTYNSISEEDRARLEQLAPSTADIGGFLVKLDAIAARNGVTSLSLNFAEETNSDIPPFSVMDLTLNLQGTYESFQNYLEDLEKFIRIVDVTDITFSPPTAEGDSVLFSVRAKTYLLR